MIEDTDDGIPTKNEKTKDESIVKRERGEAENKLERERVEAENKLERERVEAENKLERERVEAESKVNRAFIDAKNIIYTTVNDAENIINQAAQENNNLRIILNEIDNIKKNAKIEVENMKTLLVGFAERIKNIEKISIENRERIKKTLSVNLKKNAEIKAKNLKQYDEISSNNRYRISDMESEHLKQIAVEISEKMNESTGNTVENIRNVADTTSSDLIKYANDFSQKTKKDTYDIIEHGKQSKWIQKLQSQSKKQKIYVIILIIVVVFGSVYFSQMIFVEHTPRSFPTNYLIQNLRGDVVDTWVSWRMPSNVPFHIHVLNSKYATQERLDAILDVITTNEKIELDDSLQHKGPEGTTSTYYLGWNGALNSITSPTKFNIPTNIHFDVDKVVPTGNIEIELTPLSSPDGYSAYTKSIIDEQNHQILKATITVYDIDKISLEDLKTLIRHELGHGFGLAHSTAPEDLMAPVITTNYPYISECDVNAIKHLYEGGQLSKVVCEK